MTEDFYEVLGVSRDADEDEIKQAYRTKAAEYHPDVSDDPDAEEKFKRIQKARDVLTDEEKRRAYDRLGHDRFAEAEKRGGFDQGRAGPRGGAGDPFGAGGPFGSGGPFGADSPFGDIFEEFFGGGAGGRNRRRQGPDLKTTMEIDLEEAYAGATKRVTVRRPEQCDTCGGSGHPPDADPRTCPDCGGRGQVTRVQQTALGRVQQTATCSRCEGEGRLYERPCSACRGEGIVRREATLSVDIPPGIRDGQTLRMEGEGAPGENGGPPGDLLIDVTVRDHETFEREGEDIYHRYPISFPQAVFGDSVTVPTLDGEAELTIPAGTQSGESFRLRGKGMPRLRGRGRGDHYVQVQIVTPETLNSEQREALEAFAAAGGEEVDVGRGFFDRIRNNL